MMNLESVGRRDRAQVGIGTLIVFIAMVLVAAIAAGVFINTAGVLGTKSEEVAQQSSQQVSNRLMVVSAVGNVTAEINDERTKTGGDAKENESVDVVKLSVALAPGAGPVNLSQATIEWVGPNQAKTLVHGTSADHEPTVSGSDSGTFDLNPDPDDGGSDGDTHETFNTYSINSGENVVVESPEQRTNVYLNVSQIESMSDGGTADADWQPLAEGSTVELKITTPSGATTLYRLTVPRSLAGENYVSV